MKINKSPITKDFMKENKLVFHPQSHEEATFIQEQLFKLGASWCNGDPSLPGAQEKCIRLSLNVDYGDMKIERAFDYNGALLCSADDFEVGESARFARDITFTERTLLEKFNTMAAQIERLEAKIDALSAGHHSQASPFNRKQR